MRGIQKNLFFWLLILMVLVFVFWSSLQPVEETVELNFTDVILKIETNQVESIGVKDNVVGGFFKGRK